MACVRVLALESANQLTVLPTNIPSHKLHHIHGGEEENAEA